MKWLENFIKGPLTSLIGLGIVLIAAFGYATSHVSEVAAGVLGLAGATLAFSKDKVPGYIEKFWTALINRIFGNQK